MSFDTNKARVQLTIAMTNQGEQTKNSRSLLNCSTTDLPTLIAIKNNKSDKKASEIVLLVLIKAKYTDSTIP